MNGQAVYGSRAWTKFGEGEMVNGKLRTLPGGNLGKRHADFQYAPEDIRFTVGKDNNLYAFCMATPEEGQTVTIKSLAKGALQVKRVTLLGCDRRLKWKQTADGLRIKCPKMSPDQPAIVFCIETR